MSITPGKGPGPEKGSQCQMQVKCFNNFLMHWMCVFSPTGNLKVEAINDIGVCLIIFLLTITDATDYCIQQQQYVNTYMYKVSKPIGL